MAILKKIIRNESGVKQNVIRRVLEDTETFEVPHHLWSELAQDEEVESLINSGDLVLNNGTIDLDITSALKIIKRYQMDEAADIELPPGTTTQGYWVGKEGNDTTGTGSILNPFLTINKALSVILDASSTKQYVVHVGPGTYMETQIVMKPSVSIQGSETQATIITPSDPTNHLIIGAAATLRFCTIKGVTTAGKAGIYSTASGFQLRNCVVRDNPVNIKIEGTASLASITADTNIITGVFDTGIWLKNSGAGVSGVFTNSIFNAATANSGAKCSISEGASVSFIFSSLIANGSLTTNGLTVKDGATLKVLADEIKGFAKGIWVENVGAAPIVDVLGGNFDANTMDIVVDHPTATGAFGNCIATRSKITNAAPTTVQFAFQDPAYGFVCNGVTDINGFRTQEDVTVTAASTLSLIKSSPMCQVFIGSTSGQIVKLPDATTISIGHRIEIWNQSVVTVLVQDNSGTLLLISVPSQTAQAVLKDNSTAAGVWMFSLTQPAETIATWTGSRYFAVDYDNGNDNNVGYSDTSLADAGIKAIKTLERLRLILPGDGNGQTAVVGIRARSGGTTYRNIADTADDNLNLTTYTDYAQLIIRGTNTVATANTVAFSDDAADQVTCGAQIVSGTNTGGYNPTGSPTSSVISCQLNGGGAANLSAEPALLGYRIRFAYNTTTVALQNAVGMIWSNTSSQITLGTNLPATPATSDIFYIEEPSVAIGRCFIFSNNPFNAVTGTFTIGGLSITGIKFVGSTAPVIQQRGAIALTNLSFIDVPNSASFSAISVAGALDFRIGSSYTNQAGAAITTGAGFRSNGTITAASCQQIIMTHHVTNQARPQILQVYSFTIGGACVSAGGIIFQNCGSQPALTNLGGNSLGNAGSSTIRRFRSTGVNVGDAINITRSGMLVYGVDITGAGSAPMINLKGVGVSVSINDVVGSSGNTGDGLILTLARDSHVLMGTLAANTFTGGAGRDIVCTGNVLYLHADYARTDLKDAFGNHVQGSGNSILGSTVYATNDTNANVGQYMICRATGSGVVRAALATTNAGASGVVGVSQSAFTTAQSTMLCNGGGTWIQFDATPTAGNVAYLSNINSGQAKDAPPTLLSLHQKLRLGRILRVSGTLGFVCLFPEIVPVLSDGGA